MDKKYIREWKNLPKAVQHFIFPQFIKKRKIAEEGIVILKIIIKWCCFDFLPGLNSSIVSWVQPEEYIPGTCQPKHKCFNLFITRLVTFIFKKFNLRSLILSKVIGAIEGQTFPVLNKHNKGYFYHCIFYCKWWI